MGTSPPAAGWYRDPSRRFEHRYWNGTAWTDHVLSGGARAVDHDLRAPVPALAVTAVTTATSASPETYAPAPAAGAAAEPGGGANDGAEADGGVDGTRWPAGLRFAVLGGAALLALGAALPWAEAESARSSFSESGIDGFGSVTILAAVMIVLSFLMVPRSPRAAGLVTVFAALALAVGGHDAIDTTRKANDLVDRSPAGVTAGVGIGLWLTLAASAIVLAAGIVALVISARRSR